MRCDLLITGGALLTFDERLGVIDDGAVAIAERSIVAVGDRATITAGWEPDRRIDASGQVVAPGFVDAHVHIGGFLFAGRPYTPSVGPGDFSGGGDAAAILPMVARFCSMPVDPDLAYAAIRPALAAMLRAGFTGVVDAGGPGADGVARAAAELGIRAAVGPSLADQWPDGSGMPLRRQADADKLLAGAAEFIDRHDHPDGTLRALVSSVDGMACSDELLAGLAELTRARDVPTHVHTNITAGEDAEHREWFDGESALERLQRTGMLTGRCTAMHAGYVTDRDVALLAEAGATVNHNPVGNALLGFGVAAQRALPRLLAAGVPVVLGSDTVDGIDSPFDLIRATLMLHRDAASDDSAVTLEQALAAAVGGAAGLGRPGLLGRIVPGQLADLVLVDRTRSHHIASDHPVPVLARQAHAGDVRTVIVAGEPRVEDGRLVAFDEAELMATAATARRTLQEMNR